MSSMIPQPQPDGLKTQDSAAVVSSAIASGGLIGAGLAILALNLSPKWQPVGIALVPTLSSACTMVVRFLAAEVSRRYSKKQWESDRRDILGYIEHAMPLSQEALANIQDYRAQRILQDGIARMQRIQAMVLSAMPCQRPWLAELEMLSQLSTEDMEGFAPELSNKQS